MVGSGTVVRRPAGVAKLDFEAELAVVIGRSVCRVERAAALDHVAGYTILDDVSAREFQFDVTPAQTSFAKSMDGFAPMGPCLVTADEIPNRNGCGCGWRRGSTASRCRKRQPPTCWLQPGDHIDMSIEGIERLEHRIGDDAEGLPSTATA